MDLLKSIHSHLRKRAQERDAEARKPGRLWGSSMGYPVRRIVAPFDPSMDSHPLTVRALMTFAMGDMVHDLIRKLAREANPELAEHIRFVREDGKETEFTFLGPLNDDPDAADVVAEHLEELKGDPNVFVQVPEASTDEVKVEIPLKARHIAKVENLPGDITVTTVAPWVTVVKPDGVPLNVETAGEERGVAILEIKGMTAFGFRRFKDKGPEERLFGQFTAECLAIEHKMGIEVNQVLVVAVCRETAAFAQQLVTISAQRKAELIAKMEECAETANAIYRGKMTALDVPECDGEDYGWKPAGRGFNAKIAGRDSSPVKVVAPTLAWGCGYCAFKRSCFPEAVGILDTYGKPKHVDAKNVPPGAIVTDFGRDVALEPSWKILDPDPNPAESDEDDAAETTED